MPDDATNSTDGDAGAAQNQPQQNQEPPKTFTQDQLNAAVAEEKRNWQKQLKDLKSKADEWDKLQEASKTELEKITGERDQHKTEAEAAKLEAAKLRALMKAGAPPDKIDGLLKRVVGSTPEEIDADVQELASLGLLTSKPPDKTGAGSNPANPTDPGKKTWKKSEIQALLKDPTQIDPETLKDINLAQREGRIDYNS